MNVKDTVKLDIPLFIRLLEYAREDAGTDMDLHQVAENCIKLGLDGETLTMGQYDEIVGISTEQLDEVNWLQKMAGIKK